MHYKILYTDLTDLLMVQTDGRMNAGDYIGMARQILGHPRWLPDINVIFDHTALDFKDVPVSDLQMIRSFHLEHEERIGSGKSAIVVAPGLSPAWLELWGQGEKIKTKNQVQVFESCVDAVNWIKEDKKAKG